MTKIEFPLPKMEAINAKLTLEMNLHAKKAYYFC